MKIIGNITQTYGFNRTIEIERFLEYHNIKAFNLLDIKTFSFHNCTEHFKKWSKEKILKKIPDCIFFEWNNITYGESIILYLKELKKLGCTDFIMWQDDNCINWFDKTYNIFDELLIHYKSNIDIKYLKIYSHYSILYNDIEYHNKINIKDNLFLYSYDFKDLNDKYISYNDGNYILDINIAIEKIFTSDIINMNVWELESYLDDKIKILDINLYISNAYIFDVFNIHGRTRRPYFTMYQNMISYKDYNNNILD